MKTNGFCKVGVRFWYFSIFIFLVAHSAQAQFQIVGMLYNGNRAESVNLTILLPNAPPFNGTVPFDPNKIYNSGTTFKTPENTSISILCKDQKQIMKPNSTLKLTLVNNGITAKTISGSVKHVLHDVKGKLSFYKAGNGYTWAHAEGTVFEVEAFEKSKKMKVSTQTGTVAIIEEIPVTIAEKAKNQIDRSGKADERQLSQTQKTYNTAGEEYVTNSVETIEYATYEQALAAYDQEVYAANEKVDENNLDYALVEQLAGDFMLLGGLYLENGQPDMAIDPLRLALNYNSLTDPEGILTLESYLYLAEALILSEEEADQTEGEVMVKEIISTLEEIGQEDTQELAYALKNGDDDLAWDLANELAVIFEYLGWSYDLMGDTETADTYYDLVDQYNVD